MPPNNGNGNGNGNGKAEPPPSSLLIPSTWSPPPSMANAASPFAQVMPAPPLSTDLAASVTTTATFDPPPGIFTPLTSVVTTTTIFPQAQMTAATSHSHHDNNGNSPASQQNSNIGGNVGGLSGGVMAAASVVVTLIVVLMLVACCCVVFRKRRRRDPSTPTVMQPMVKAPGPTPVAQAHTRNPERPAAASLTSPSTTSTPSTNTRHVLLTTTMDQSYYTGIDTSDAISLAERQPPATALCDEPPPPYRPRSVPPVSRGNSLCVTDGLAGYQPGQNMRSPFDDPVDEDDGLSDLGNDFCGRDIDQLSAVSDLSYQEEPTAVRLAV